MLRRPPSQAGGAAHVKQGVTAEAMWAGRPGVTNARRLFQSSGVVVQNPLGRPLMKLVSQQFQQSNSNSST